MAYHVEIRRSFHRAWAFNLDERALAGRMLDRWRRGLVIELGDRDWDPRDCRIAVLEGPELHPIELAHGQGWRNAQRSGADVTASVLAGAATGPATAAGSVAVIAAGPVAGAAGRSLLESLELATVDWLAVRGRLLSAAGTAPGPPAAAAGLAAALLVLAGEPPDGGWLFDAGLAVATLGSGAIVVLAGGGHSAGHGELPVALNGLDVVRLGEPDEPGSREAIALRLSQAGCVVAPA